MLKWTSLFTAGPGLKAAFYIPGTNGVAPNWTECLALPVREQALIVVAIDGVHRRLPFPILGLDTDNDSAFLNDTLWNYCQEHGIMLTPSLAYHENDQAWVEKTNGAIVRKYGWERELRQQVAHLKRVADKVLKRIFFQIDPGFAAGRRSHENHD